MKGSIIFSINKDNNFFCNMQIFWQENEGLMKFRREILLSYKGVTKVHICLIIIN